MRPVPYATLAVLLLLTASCGGPAPVGGLMGSLPAGHDLYLTLHPEGIGMEQVLASLGRTMRQAGSALPGDFGALGFDPFDWSAWSENLALEPGREIGLVIDFESGETLLAAFYLPSTDPDAVEDLFTGLADSTEDFRGAIGFRSAGDYTVAVRAMDEATLAGFPVEGCPDLSTDPEYALLMEAADSTPAAICLYANSGVSDDGSGFEGVLLTCGVEGSILDLQVLVDMQEAMVGEYTALLAGGPSGPDVRLPGDLGSVVRLSLDMSTVKEVLASTGLDRELGQGILMFGFDTLDALLDLFNGDIYLGFRVTDGVYTGVIGIGLRDAAGAERLLTSVYGVMTASGEGPEIFEINGATCYRMESPAAGGMERLEVGILDGTLLITGGIPLTETAEGPRFGSIVEESGLGIANDGGLLFISEMSVFMPMLNIESVPEAAAALQKVDRMAGSLRAAGGLFDLNLSLGTAGGEPFRILVDAVGELILHSASRSAGGHRTENGVLD
jgi:hypothetical protein